MTVIASAAVSGGWRHGAHAEDAPRAVAYMRLAILAAAALGNAWLGPITPVSNGDFGRGRPTAPARSEISAAAGNLLERLDP